MGGGAKGARPVVEENRGKVTVNHRGGVFDGEKAPLLLAPPQSPPVRREDRPKRAKQECSKGCIFSTKTGRGTGRRNLYPIYILSVPPSLPRVTDV